MKQRLLYIFAGTLVTFLLQMAAGLLGPAGMLFNLLAPVPAAYAGMRQGAALSGAIAALTTLAVFTVAGPAASLSYLLQFGIGSCMLPLLLRRGWGWDRAVAMTLAVVLVTAVLVVGGYLGYRGQPVGGAVQQYVRSEIDLALEMSRSADLPESEKAELAALAQSTADLLGRIYPGVVVAVACAVLLLTLLLLAALSGGRYVLPGPPFTLWKAPEPLIWPLIAGGFVALLTKGWTQSAAMNLLVVLLPLYFLQGLAVITYFFRQSSVSPLMRALGYLLLIVFNPFQLIVAGIGVFDLWVDFRKPRIKNT